MTRVPCSIDGCEKPRRSRLYCAMHYTRVIRHGDPEYVAHLDPARFWAQADRSGGDTACWPWLGTLDRDGYGRLKWNGQVSQAHRVAHELAIGPIPSGLEVDHVKARGCTRRDCVNPAHLEAVAGIVNNLRSDSWSARNARKITCCRGHEFAGENLRILPDGRRRCRTCERLRRQQREARQKRSDRETAVTA